MNKEERFDNINSPSRPISGDSTNAFRPVPTTPPRPISGGEYYSTNAFRPAPTRPGKSRGGGHSFANENNELVEQAVNSSPKGDQYFDTGYKDDFRPTASGHSPGVGQAIGKNAEPNA
ncbi:hypothetical protein TIFTF001_002670 [Ficus carica]|uniref:Uncharacterized protein n=1 Tax=Ficus carica TaxID=3494 RepID=A0AA88CU59_FICCA|nr:hypothetical protein TIFTF001_002670 [Ficus carica]